MSGSTWTLYLIETTFNTFANRNRSRSGSSWKSCLIRVYSVCWWKYDISDPTLEDLTSNFFVLCTNMKIYLWLFTVGGAYHEYSWRKGLKIKHICDKHLMSWLKCTLNHRFLLICEPCRMNDSLWALWLGLKPSFSASFLNRQYTVKPKQNGHSQKDQKLGFKTNYRLMQVKSIAECLGAFCNTFDFH